MNSKRPIQAKSTHRILRSILPDDFKMVKDKSSNGYKYINLLYGVEIDIAKDKLSDIYNNSFISNIDLSNTNSLYEVRLSGIPRETLSSDIGHIKITDETEFYNGSPTRIIPISGIPLNSGYINNGIIGLNYFRTNERGSGYLLANLDLEQESSYISSIYPSYRMKLKTSFDDTDDIVSYTGFYNGISTQSYSSGSNDEILEPLDSGYLSKNYPLTRTVQDESGVYHTIDHYEPYLGWTRDENGNLVAVVDYSGSYYYNANGDKVYYRTAFNNPYGYNNYTSAYLDLRYTPISGTLKVYDIDILDSSGNATEIPASGKNLYYFKSPLLNSQGSGVFDPIYLGYSSTVPYDMGFTSNIAGSSGNLLKTTSWSYLHEGFTYNEESKSYIDGSGKITNKIKIENPNSRYLVEYKYKIHDYSRYITTLDSIGYINLDIMDPIYTLDNISGNIIKRDYNFTRDPRFIKKNARGIITSDERSKRITFDGLDVRPGKNIYRIDFNLPLELESGPLTHFKSINGNKIYIGYTDEHVPQVTTQRNYYLNCPFNQSVSNNSVTEQDLTGNGNELSFYGSGNSKVIRINYGSSYGKKIINDNISYFQCSGVYLLKNYTHFDLSFKIKKRQQCTLLYIQDSLRERYLELNINSNGLISIRSDGYKYTGSEYFNFENIEKRMILRYRPDQISSSIPYIELYYSDPNNMGFKQIDLFRTEDTQEVITSGYIHCFKNCTIDVDHVKIYNEVF